MSLMTIPWTLSKRLWARARARGEPSYFIVFSKNARCSSVRGCTYLTIGTSSWGVQSKAKVYIVLDMGRYYTKKLLGGRLHDYAAEGKHGSLLDRLLGQALHKRYPPGSTSGTRGGREPPHGQSF